MIIQNTAPPIIHIPLPPSMGYVGNSDQGRMLFNGTSHPESVVSRYEVPLKILLGVAVLELYNGQKTTEQASMRVRDAI